MGPRVEAEITIERGKLPPSAVIVDVGRDPARRDERGINVGDGGQGAKRDGAIDLGLEDVNAGEEEGPWAFRHARFAETDDVITFDEHLFEVLAFEVGAEAHRDQRLRSPVRLEERAQIEIGVELRV